MKCTPENCSKVFGLVMMQLEDDHGHGEFDDETDLTTAVERVVGWVEEEEKLKAK